MAGASFFRGNSLFPEQYTDVVCIFVENLQR